MTEQATETRRVVSLDGTLVGEVPVEALCQWDLMCAELATHVIATPIPENENKILGVCERHARMYERFSAPRS